MRFELCEEMKAIELLTLKVPRFKYFFVFKYIILLGLMFNVFFFQTLSVSRGSLRGASRNPGDLLGSQSEDC